MFEVKISEGSGWRAMRFTFDTAEEALQFALIAKKAYADDKDEVEVTVIIGIGEVKA